MLWAGHVMRGESGQQPQMAEAEKHKDSRNTGTATLVHEIVRGILDRQKSVKCGEANGRACGA